jgi:tetratricopeptide (TPR) repeat protein
MTCVLALCLFAADLSSARRLIDGGHVTEGLREIEQALKSAPNDPEVQYEAGEILRQLGATRAERLRQIAPDSPEAHELAGRAAEARGDLNAALVAYRAAGARFQTGNVLWRMRDFDSAQKQLEAALAANPNHALANLRLGQILLQKDQATEALGYLRKSVEANPDLVEAHRELGKALRRMGRFNEAVEQFQFVAKRQPNDEFVHAQLATVYRAMGEKDLAAEQLRIHSRLLDERAAAARGQTK